MFLVDAVTTLTTCCLVNVAMLYWVWRYTPVISEPQETGESQAQENRRGRIITT